MFRFASIAVVALTSCALSTTMQAQAGARRAAPSTRAITEM
jgi:hypothetical protein